MRLLKTYGVINRFFCFLPVFAAMWVKPSKLEILKDRIVVAFPDLGAYEIWKKKASELSFHILVSEFLEKNSTDEQREKGLDIADYL